MQTIKTIAGNYKMLYSVIMKIIKQLEEYRLENRLSQEKLAEILGVSFATVNRWFNGRTVPNKMQTYHIEKLLKGGK
jgi:transcriptional regulator with XRE-family HTH domain